MQINENLIEMSGDRYLTPPERWLYHRLNRWRNGLPPLVDPQVNLIPFSLPDAEVNALIPLLSPTSSPSRMMCDLFWARLPWAQIQKALGGIHLVDAGCGTGSVFRNLRRFSGDRISGYFGFDVEKREMWKELASPTVQFVEAKAKAFRTLIPEQSNFFVSQSALEHFPSDVVYFSQVKQWLSSRRGPFLHLHLFPSPVCLEHYGTHGYRQYSIRGVQRVLQEMEGAYSLARLYALGGQNCNQVHESQILNPRKKLGLDLREKDPEGYSRMAFEAVRRDFAERQTANPSFFALWMQSGTDMIFDLPT